MQAKGMTFAHPAQAVLLANVISAERAGLRSSRDRTISAFSSISVSNCACVGAGDWEFADPLTRANFAAPSLINNQEQLPAIDCRSTASSTVGVCSTARRKLNQVATGL